MYWSRFITFADPEIVSNRIGRRYLYTLRRWSNWKTVRSGKRGIDKQENVWGGWKMLEEQGSARVMTCITENEDETVGWHPQLDGHEFEQALRAGDGQGGLSCCSPWRHRVGHDWVTELNWMTCIPSLPLERHIGGWNSALLIDMSNIICIFGLHSLKVIPILNWATWVMAQTSFLSTWGL